MRLLKLLASILLCQAVGIGGAFFTRAAIPEWYATLARPSFAPPNWVFGPVWTLLYLLMGIVLYRLWIRESHGPERTCALRWFFIQLALNAVWTPVFFGLKALWPAFGIIVFLLISIFLAIRALARLDALSARLLWPYLLWVSFATALNLEFARLNG
jgi:benzodiazapine receptor